LNKLPRFKISTKNQTPLKTVEDFQENVQQAEHFQAVISKKRLLDVPPPPDSQTRHKSVINKADSHRKSSIDNYSIMNLGKNLDKA